MPQKAAVTPTAQRSWKLLRFPSPMMRLTQPSPIKFPVHALMNKPEVCLVPRSHMS